MGSSELSNSLTFPIKLKKIVDAEQTDHLIHWAEDGNSFHITDENQFARDIIPHYFKHNNISSFIRQLNMYDFHKVNRIDNGLSIIGTGNDDSQWVHPNFIRDKPELLPGVLRKVTNSSFNNSIINQKSISNNEIVPFDSVKNDINQLAKMVQYLRKRDEETTQQLKTLQNENHELYTELMFLRDQHDKQSKCIDMLVEFFSQYAKTPHNSRLRPKRNILALECPQQGSINYQNQNNVSEPPRKFQATSSNESTNNMFKGKKVIKISNVNQASHIDVKTPKIVSNNNGFYPLSKVVNNKPQRVPVIYTLSLPKTVNNITKPQIKALSSSNTVSLPAHTNNFSFNTSRPLLLNSNPSTKAVTLSTQNIHSPPSYNAQYFDRSPEDNIYNNVNDSDQQQLSPNPLSDIRKEIFSGISTNVNDVEQCLNDIHELFSTDPPLELEDMTIDDDWKMLLENIKSDHSLQEFDPGRIHGHELIPFSGSQGDVEEVNNESLDMYSVDDLLQTPNIQPGMSSLSLDTMDDSHYISLKHNVKKQRQ